MSSQGTLVYVVDDDASVRESVERVLRSDGLMAKTFASGEEFLAASRAEVPSCLVLDVNLPGVSGLEVQQELAKSDVPVPVVFLTGYADIPMTVRAIKAGAANFLTKPVDDTELLNAIRQCITAYHKERLCVESDTEAHYKFEDIVGKSKALRKVLQQIAIVAPTDCTVLIYGETGTGKELIARAIHDHSARHAAPFVKLNCAAIPSGLLESELFGHEKGAFTGAISQRIGRFELANHGTMFLDEVGEIPLELQPKLLRVLQEREFERLGSSRTLHTHTRLIAATNRDLEQMVEEQRFRSDLFYRLNVIPIRIPSLRERQEDIPLLVRHFAQQYARRMNKQIEKICSETMSALCQYQWPGNIRELQNVIERAVIVTKGSELQVSVSELQRCATPNRESSGSGTLEEVERAHILATLKDTGWTIAGRNGAAARLGLNRSTLQFRMKKLGISVVRAATT